MYSVLQLLLSNLFQMSFSFVHISSQNYHEGKRQSSYSGVLKMKQEEVTIFFIVSSPFATAKKAESVITWRSWKIITI